MIGKSPDHHRAKPHEVQQPRKHPSEKQADSPQSSPCSADTQASVGHSKQAHHQSEARIPPNQNVNLKAPERNEAASSKDVLITQSVPPLLPTSSLKPIRVSLGLSPVIPDQRQSNVAGGLNRQQVAHMLQTRSARSLNAATASTLDPASVKLPASSVQHVVSKGRADADDFARGQEKARVIDTLQRSKISSPLPVPATWSKPTWGASNLERHWNGGVHPRTKVLTHAHSLEFSSITNSDIKTMDEYQKKGIEFMSVEGRNKPGIIDCMCPDGMLRRYDTNRNLFGSMHVASGSIATFYRPGIKFDDKIISPSHVTAALTPYLAGLKIFETSVKKSITKKGS